MLSLLCLHFRLHELVVREGVSTLRVPEWILVWRSELLKDAVIKEVIEHLTEEDNAVLKLVDVPRVIRICGSDAHRPISLNEIYVTSSGSPRCRRQPEACRCPCARRQPFGT